MAFLSPLVWSNLDITITDASISRQDMLLVKKSINRKNGRKEKSQLTIILDRIESLHNLQPYYLLNPLLDESSMVKKSIDKHFCWESLPRSVDISGDAFGNVPKDRTVRKRQQLSNFISFLLPLLKPGVKVADFCCGGGHQSIPLAWLFPQCTFLLVDMKLASLNIAKTRVEELGLKNVTFHHLSVESFQENFDIGCALHGCGSATDEVLLQCIRVNAAYVLMPCCVGKLFHSSLRYPLSESMRSKISKQEYYHLSKAADFGHDGYDSNIDSTSPSTSTINNSSSDIIYQRRKAKSIIERDRMLLTKEHNYQAWMTVCHPVTCTPKNDILIGIPNSHTEDIREMEEWCNWKT